MVATISVVKRLFVISHRHLGELPNSRSPGWLARLPRLSSLWG